MYYASAREMARLDDLAINNGLEIRQMMELAGINIVPLFKRLGIGKKVKIVVVVGKGNKGGDGLCAARHLVNNGWKNIKVIMLSAKLSPDAKHHQQLLKKMKLAIISFNNKKSHQWIKNADILIDSLIGYNLSGAPRKDFAVAINLMNKAKGKIVAYDMPSGISATAGFCYEPCIKAWATLTLALPKKLFKLKDAKINSGKIFLGDIGIPAMLYDKIKKNSRPDFIKSNAQLIKL
ncbi:NAD(P)H-hydrate epimerase [Patescibacteria group bacterium]